MSSGSAWSDRDRLLRNKNILREKEQLALQKQREQEIAALALEKEKEKEKEVKDKDTTVTTTAAPVITAPTTIPEFPYFAPQNRPKVVQLDGLVLLKIVNHAKDAFPVLVSGQLLGLDIDQKVDVTHSFALPPNVTEKELDQYQNDMLRNLDAVNVDNNVVGWYQCADIDSYFTQELVDTQYSLQKLNPNAVVVIYDPFQTPKGRLVIKAYRLSDDFMKTYTPSNDGNSTFNHLEFYKNGHDNSSVFVNIPITVHNNHIAHGFMYELSAEINNASKIRDVERLKSGSVDRLSLNFSSFLEKNINSLGNTVDNHCHLQHQYHNYLNEVRKQKNQQEEYKNKKAIEAETRRNQGLPVIEEDLSKHPLFQPIPKPNRLDTVLLSNQIESYSTLIKSVADNALQRLYLVEGIQRKMTDAEIVQMQKLDLGSK
jgi:translation initiation factor 3 subunit H